MDPNRFVERMLWHMQEATEAARNGDSTTALAHWQDVQDNLEDYQAWLAKGGFAADLKFSYSTPSND